MSTSSERALRTAAAAANTGGAVVNPRPDADRAQRLAAAEATVVQAIEAARQVVVAA
jgi:hypothetical protein